jgi:hypothetical protein
MKIEKYIKYVENFSNKQITKLFNKIPRIEQQDMVINTIIIEVEEVGMERTMYSLKKYFNKEQIHTLMLTYLVKREYRLRKLQNTI